MSYYFSKVVEGDFEEVEKKVREELKKEGFGVLTEIDVKKTLKEKLGVDYKRYVILGACNPPFAYKALQTEENIGVMLPCNVLVKEKGEKEVEVVAVDPIASMEGIKNKELEQVASQVREKLQKVVQSV